MLVVPVAFAMILVLLYINFQSITDVLIVITNVVVLCLGGIWALVFTHTNFSVSAAVGFISIFGVGIMGGIILASRARRSKTPSCKRAATGCAPC